MEGLLIALVLALALAAVVVGLIWLVRRVVDATTDDRETEPARKAAVPLLEARDARVVLEVRGVDPDDKAVQRLAQELVSRTLDANPDVQELTVVSLDDVELVRVRRRPPSSAPAAPPTGGVVAGDGEGDVAAPPGRPESRHHAPSAVRSADVTSSRPAIRFEPGELEHPDRPLADAFDLPPAVRASIREPQDIVDVVRAILEAGRQPVQVQGDVLVVGDEAVVVVQPSTSHTMQEAQSRAFLGFKKTGATRGVVITVGFLDPAEARRRELLAPELGHVGPEAVQRMADAVAVGADPLAFVIGPAVL